jgi:hypothetical protein
MARLIWICAVLFLAVAVAAAAADEPERPWAAGVDAAEQTRALELFRDGNQLFEQSHHAEALARYREALARWDHPAIRYNIAVALIHLDQPLAAIENLERALAFGAAPFDKETYAQALTYQKLLAGQLAEITVACREPGAEVSLDGEKLFAAPGALTRRLSPGPHQLVASQPGHLSDSRALMLLPGKRVEVSLQPRPFPKVTTQRRWRVWKPWLVTVTGALLSVAGVPLVVEGKASYDAYDQGIRAQCPNGCPRASLPSGLKADRAHGDVEVGVGATALAAGGTLVLSGVVMLVLNAPRVVEQPLGGMMSFAPTVERHGAGGSLSIRF